jgi:hypothetical protein
MLLILEVDSQPFLLLWRKWFERLDTLPFHFPAVSARQSIESERF